MKKSISILLLIVLTMSVMAQSEKRIALVIGNAAYSSAPLANPVNDADLMATTLESLGFTVKKYTNVGLAQMNKAIQEFSKQLGNYNVALFYYAGHGIQSAGVNYLIPVDATLKEEVDLEFEATDVNKVVRQFEKYDGNTNIVLLEACRNNPYRSWSRGGNRGFVAITAPSGTIIGFATAEGSTAADGTSGNGLYTKYLVQQMTKAQSIEEVLKQTHNQVKAQSNKAQLPQYWSQYGGSFCFVKPTGNTQQSNNTATTEEETPVFNPGNVVVEYGQININSEIAGDLYLDNKKLGNINANSVNNNLDKIKTGTHTVEIRGNETYTQTIIVEKDKTANISAKSTKTTTTTTTTANDQPDRLVDTRDNHVYKLVIIGNQTWMAENLAYKANNGCWAYNNDEINVTKYGYLYDWETAKNSCPAGWHLPSDEEWTALTGYLGDNAGTKMKDTADWSFKPCASNESGFSALRAGLRESSGGFDGRSAYFWSRTEFSSEASWVRGLILGFIPRGRSKSGSECYKFELNNSEGISVRCIKD